MLGMWKCSNCGHIFEASIFVSIDNKCPKCNDEYPYRYDEKDKK